VDGGNEGLLAETIMIAAARRVNDELEMGQVVAVMIIASMIPNKLSTFVESSLRNWSPTSPSSVKPPRPFARSADK
jgi:hypothetical protein